MSPSPDQPPAVPPVMHIGKAIILLTLGEDFRNGYQAGHMTYLLKRYTYRFSDREFTHILVAAIDQEQESDLFNAGFVTGWLITAYEYGLLPEPVPAPKEPEGETHEP
jgi:hypothetical protein